MVSKAALKIDFETKKRILTQLQTIILKATSHWLGVRVILFGSFLSQPNDSSDIDLLVIIPNYSEDLPFYILRNQFIMDFNSYRKGFVWPVDLIVVSQKQFNDQKQLGGVCFVAENDGVELYPKNYYHH